MWKNEGEGLERKERREGNETRRGRDEPSMKSGKRTKNPPSRA